MLLVHLLALLPAAFASESFGGNVYYLGDIHSHTTVSGDAASAGDTKCEGQDCGDIDDVLDIARDNGLDFIAFTDHVNGGNAGSSTEYETLLDRVIAGHSPATGLVTLPAAEVFFTTGTTNLGHKTLLLFGSNTEVDGFAMADASPNGTSTRVTSCDKIWEWMTDLTASFGPALLVPHHPGGVSPMPTDWSCHDPTWEPVVEIYSNHGSSMNDGSGFDEIWSGWSTGSTISEALDPAGLALQFGFVGGTDRHDTRPGEVCAGDPIRVSQPYGGGLTIAVIPDSEAFDRDTLYDAFMDRRTVTTSGPLVPIAVRYEVDGVQLAGLGEDLALDPNDTLTVSVSVPTDHAPFVSEVVLYGPRGSNTMSAVADDEWSITVQDDGDGLPEWVYPVVKIDGGAWYASVTCEDGGADQTEWLWVSPSYIGVRTDDDGDGYSTLGGDCDDAEPSIHPGADEIWYDGIDQNCDVRSDYDADGDTYDATAWGGDDCNDEAAWIHPGAAEEWYDGVDQNCDGAWDYDADDDDYDAADYGGRDCDDNDPNAFPGAADAPYDGVVLDCDGADEFDQDRDGEPARGHGGNDCDDTRADVRPGLAEIWYDGVDQDCDGNDADQDRDGYAFDADCDDADPQRWTGGTCVERRGCATAPGLPYGASLAALALLLGRPRRPRR